MHERKTKSLPSFNRVCSLEVVAWVLGCCLGRICNVSLGVLFIFPHLSKFSHIACLSTAVDAIRILLGIHVLLTVKFSTSFTDEQYCMHASLKGTSATQEVSFRFLSSQDFLLSLSPFLSLSLTHTSSISSFSSHRSTVPNAGCTLKLVLLFSYMWVSECHRCLRPGGNGDVIDIGHVGFKFHGLTIRYDSVSSPSSNVCTFEHTRYTTHTSVRICAVRTCMRAFQSVSVCMWVSRWAKKEHLFTSCVTL